MANKTKDNYNIIVGWGINDSPSPVSWINPETGKRDTCPYYQDWVDIVRRSKSITEKQRHPTYLEVQICEEWKYLSNFIKWVDSQPNKDWMCCDLDKDLLSEEVKIYSPDTCVYLPSNINTFLSNSGATRGAYKLGVYWETSTGKFRACCQNPFTKKNDKLGRFTTELEAHLAWQAKKHEHALRLADLQQDPRVADALRQRYSPDKDWTKA